MISRLSFTLVCALLLIGGVPTNADEKDSDDVLGRFVGVWKISATAKPAIWAPAGGDIAEQESAVWALKKRLLVSRTINQAEKKKIAVDHDLRPKAKRLSGFWIRFQGTVGRRVATHMGRVGQ